MTTPTASLHLGIDEGDAILVASQAADRLGGGLGERPAVPHHAQTIVTSGEDDLRGLVSECYSIGIIMVGIDLGGGGGGEEGLCERGRGGEGVREEGLCERGRGGREG